MVLPEVGCCLAFEVLGLAVSLEDDDELGRQADGLAASFLDFPEDQAAALAVGACCRVPGAAGRADPGIANRDADMRAAGLAKGFRAAARARPPVAVFGADGYV